MFDLPAAKRVRREDLNAPNGFRSESRSPSPDSDVAAQLQARLASLYQDGPEDVSETESKDVLSNAKITLQVSDDTRAEDVEKEYEFRLFSKKAGTTDSAVTTKIKIASPSQSEEVVGDGAFRASRSLDHYHISASTSWSIRQAQFSSPSVAISGSWILSNSGQANVGCRMPWRVKTITVTKKEYAALQSIQPGAKVNFENAHDRKSRNKPNKKRRIILRERKRKKEASRETAAKLKLDKEQEEREKRTRRNREKKVKKKAKEKAKKAEANDQVLEVKHDD